MTDEVEIVPISGKMLAMQVRNPHNKLSIDFDAIEVGKALRIPYVDAATTKRIRNKARWESRDVRGDGSPARLFSVLVDGDKVEIGRLK